MARSERYGFSAQLKLYPFPSAWTRRDMKYLTKTGFHSTFLFLNNNLCYQLFRVFKVILLIVSYPIFDFDSMV